MRTSIFFGLMLIANAVRPMSEDKVESLFWVVLSFIIADTIEFVHERIRKK